MKICIPSMNPGGLDAMVSAHFGHCEVFTTVDIEGKEIKSIETVANDAAEHDCMLPVSKLSKAKVDALLVGGIGRNPLFALQQNGIRVYIGATGIVRDTVKDFLNGYLRIATIDDVCKGFCH
ncbi:MAG: dinitrogenase iron-molybdenum cofactor biosynthesis protein [Candidatus Omnitrophica bacterium CG23_combo_of_CG06-09_8_20_14_all_41_10]|uniref:Dinitrogenase iron-molybdenum cofactor biosynthesis protein n=1 Tax=Candidatus Sherwoodlollariibacterium unditelluris TaxID=1974757 RepID=A0A2G9YJU9_9BACT|nr:MAG: dinitrogenase iron-molybdenum cofactor biosynthesis protein [Candidatus Omnitrophica bacterium CG23_combo_of_CG06-09_8_20_14_all_41_10]